MRLPSIPTSMEKLLHITDANSDVLCICDTSLSIPEDPSSVALLKGCLGFSDPGRGSTDRGHVPLVKPSGATKAV